MKTIRQHTFETNSSSTHAFTVNSIKDCKPDTTFYSEDGTYNISLSYSNGENNPKDKAGFLLHFAKVYGSEDMYDNILRVVGDFSKLNIVATRRYWDNDQRTYVTTEEKPEFVKYDSDKNLYESIGDAFYEFTCEYGHGSAKKFIDDMLNIVKSDENIIKFVFSSKQGFEIESYYN